MSDPRHYTVGWLCAIPTESVAATLFLDKRHDRLDEAFVNPSDSNSYTLGEMIGHKVVIAVLPDGEYGLSSATAVLKDMVHTFANLKVVLMVGVGGGAPTAKNDIRLGDVIVSSPSNGTGGIYQYDYGKLIQNHRFEHTGFLNQPSVLLRTTVSALKVDHEVDGHQIRANIETVLKSKPRLRNKYSKPLVDHLHHADTVHPSGLDVSCANSCASGVLDRAPRTDDDHDPMIHYGIIASANSLMKDAHQRDSLAKTENILCFEMEAAGLMNHFPCLVIRGVCDYADSHKNKDWQGYAAITAAAYARDLLARMVPRQVEAEMKVKDKLDSSK